MFLRRSFLWSQRESRCCTCCVTGQWNSGCLPVSPHGEFAPTSTRQSSDQVLQIYLSHTEKKRQYCAHDETKHVYFSFFNLLKVTDELRMSSWVRARGGRTRHGAKTGINRIALVNHKPIIDIYR